MRNPIKIILALALFLILSNSESYSLHNNTVKKIREQVENASPEDWFTLAESAEKLISKGKNLEEAKSWVLQSIEISKRPYNVMLLGDYYNAIKYPEKALEYYVEALLLVNRYSEVSNGDIQRKIYFIIWPDGTAVKRKN